MRFRSSFAATGATSGTTTATDISTASRPSSASTPATAAASWATRWRRRSASSTSSPSGATRIRGRSSWRRGSTLTPGDLNRVFFTNSGSEAIESAIKLARSYHRAQGKAQKTKLIAREIAYHGTTLGALSATGIPALRTQFEPLAPGGLHVPNTNSYRWPDDRDPLWAADQIEERILFEGAETVGAVILEPLQNAGGCIPPQEGYFQRVREICDKYDVLLISDEVICAWGRLGHYFGCQRYGFQPDIVTVAKALTSAYVPMGGMTLTSRLALREPHVRPRLDLAGTRSRRPPRWRTSTPEREDPAATCSPRTSLGGPSRSTTSRRRGRAGRLLYAIELVKDKDTKEHMEDDEAQKLPAATSPASSTGAVRSAAPTTG